MVTCDGSALVQVRSRRVQESNLISPEITPSTPTPSQRLFVLDIVEEDRVLVATSKLHNYQTDTTAFIHYETEVIQIKSMQQPLYRF